MTDILAVNIRTDPNIKGIAIHGIAFKTGQLVDDMTLLLADLESLRQVEALSRLVVSKFGILS